VGKAEIMREEKWKQMHLSEGMFIINVYRKQEALFGV